MNRWVREYLLALTSRNKLFQSSGEKLRVDDIVFIDNNAARNNWKKGVIVETYPDKEHEVRIVNVGTADGKRSSHRNIKFATVYGRKMLPIICIIYISNGCFNCARGFGIDYLSSAKRTFRNIFQTG